MKMRSIRPAAGALAALAVGAVVVHLTCGPGPAPFPGRLSFPPGSTSRGNRPTPRLPAPKRNGTASVAQPAEAVPGNSLADFYRGGNLPELTPPQIDAYLAQNRSNAESLMAVSRLTNDLSFLREAAEKFPSDPRVQLDLAVRGETPEERREALDALRQAAPDNSLADYLQAADHLQAGLADPAINDLVQAHGKTGFADYLADHGQAVEEAYLAAGYTGLQAKVAGMMGMSMPCFQQLLGLSQWVVDLQGQYRQDGDAESAEALCDLGLGLAERIQVQSGRRLLIAELVGTAIERRVLKAIAPDAVTSDGRTAADRLAGLEARMQSTRELTGLAQVVLTLPEQEATTYFERVKLQGEAAALRWLRDKHGNAAPPP